MHIMAFWRPEHADENLVGVGDVSRAIDIQIRRDIHKTHRAVSGHYIILFANLLKMEPTRAHTGHVELNNTRCALYVLGDAASRRRGVHLDKLDYQRNMTVDVLEHFLIVGNGTHL